MVGGLPCPYVFKDRNLLVITMEQCLWLFVPLISEVLAFGELLELSISCTRERQVLNCTLGQ